MSLRKTNSWVPDLPDHRDLKYKLIAPATPVNALPTKADLRPKFGPCYDQGALGSCTANALGGHLELLKGYEPSRLFIYYGERALTNTVGQDSGATLRTGIKVLAGSGACAETLWPYDVHQYATKPSDAAATDALNHKITNYYRLNTVSDMKKCLSDGFPFVFGFTAYESFEGQAVASTGILNLPSTSEKLIGGHAVLGVGYDDASSRFIVRNSWGSAWGQNGYFTIPYAYLTNRMLSDDFWTIRL